MSIEAETDVYLHGVNRLLTALSRMNQTILGVRDDHAQLLRDASRIIGEHLNYDLVWLGEINRAGEIIRGASQTASALFVLGGSDPPETAIPPSAMARLHKTAVGAAKAEESVIREPVDWSGQNGDELEWYVSAFPARIAEDRTLVLLTCSRRSDMWQQAETEIVHELARDLALAIETMDVESRTQQAESALRVSEERFRRLAENSMAGIVLIQNDLYRYVNPAFAEMFGFASPSEIIDRMGPLDLAAPESRDLVRSNVQRRILGQVRSVHYQYRGLRKDRTSFDVEEYGARTIHAQRLAVIATVLDVTAREASRRRLEVLSQAGLALSSSQTVQQALASAAKEVARILPCDAADVLLFEEGTHQVRAHAHTGVDDATVGALLRRGVAVEAIPEFRRMIEMTESAVVDCLETPPVGSGDGSRRHSSECAAAPLIARGQLIGLLTAEAHTRGSFAEEDARHLRLFADHVAATVQHLRLISSLEDERNRLRTLNRVAHALSETLQLQEVASRALQEIGSSLKADASLLYLWDRTAEKLTVVSAEGVPQGNLAKLNAKLASQGSTIGKLVSGWAVSGTEALPVGFDWSPIRTLVAEDTSADREDTLSALDVPLEAHGEFIGTLSFLTSHRPGFTEADAELVQALSVQVALAIQNARFYERAARQAEAMAQALHRQEELDMMKDELIQNISHELRTPLALVMGYAEMLNSGQLGPVPDEQATAIDVITRRSRMLRSLVEDIALLWHLERRPEAREKVDLRALVETTVSEFQTQAHEQGLRLASSVPEVPVEISGVPVQLRRVLDNLIGNALKFTQSGGEISVGLVTVEDTAELAVTDSGIGVPQEKLQRIFERFYQVDGSPRRKYGGTGLGLALVKAIAEAHQGTVHATSPVCDDPDRPGTRIAIRFPLSRTAPDPND